MKRWGHWIAALGAVSLMAVLGGLLSGDPRTGAYAHMDKPSFTPTLFQWMAVGLAYYCGALLVSGRLLHRRRRPGARLAIVAVGVVLLLNELWNLFLFRLGNVGLAYFSLFPFAIAVLAAATASWRVDRPSSAALFAYLAWLGFDLWWAYQLTQLN